MNDDDQHAVSLREALSFELLDAAIDLDDLSIAVIASR